MMYKRLSDNNIKQKYIPLNFFFHLWWRFERIMFELKICGITGWHDFLAFRMSESFNKINPLITNMTLDFFTITSRFLINKNYYDYIIKLNKKEKEKMESAWPQILLFISNLNKLLQLNDFLSLFHIKE